MFVYQFSSREQWPQKLKLLGKQEQRSFLLIKNKVLESGWWDWPNNAQGLETSIIHFDILMSIATLGHSNWVDIYHITNPLYEILGIGGAKGAPLPRLCFAQLAFLFKTITFIVSSVTYTRTDRQTDGWTHRYPLLYKYISTFRFQKIPSPLFHFGLVLTSFLYLRSSQQRENKKHQGIIHHIA